MKKSKDKKFKKKNLRPSTTESRKRAFVFKPLINEDIRYGRGLGGKEYKGPGYEIFTSIKWDDAWRKFLSVDKEGVYEHKTSYSLSKELARGKDKKESAERQKYIYAAIGPRAEGEKKLCPYLGDWDLMRSSLFVGDLDKQTILFGNPKMEAVRKLITEHLDVMEVSKGVGEVMMTWFARYENWADQVDRLFNYNLFDPKEDFDTNKKRFYEYAKMQRYIFNRQVETSREVLRCFGVGENDVALLTQMMIATMRGKLGDATTSMMLAASTGMAPEQFGLRPANADVIDSTSDAAKIDAMNKGFKDNPTLSLIMGSFLQKAEAYKMPHPGVKIDGVEPEDTSIDPSEKIHKSKSKEVM